MLTFNVSKMGKTSREDDMAYLFFNHPSKHWRFGEIKQEIKIADNKVSRWLKNLEKNKIILKAKPLHKMPYYVANYWSPEYQNRKRLFAYKMLYSSGLLNHFSSLEKADAIIIFGSFTRWDWFSKSDIDVFIYGDMERPDLSQYSRKLKRDIQLFFYKDRNELMKLSEALIKNIILGYVIKGKMDFLEVRVNDRRKIGKGL